MKLYWSARSMASVPEVRFSNALSKSERVLLKQKAGARMWCDRQLIGAGIALLLIDCAVILSLIVLIVPTNVVVSTGVILWAIGFAFWQFWVHKYRLALREVIHRDYGDRWMEDGSSE